MDKKNIQEIKKGEVGTGLLIENDGYISMYDHRNKKLFESIKDSENSETLCPYPFIVSAVFQKYDIENANGRIYPENILKREVNKYLEKIKEKRAIGESNHPNDSTINLSRVAMNIIELHWEGHTLVGQLEIITSPGFRKYGIISCEGDQVANLLLQGIKIGVSSRGLGTVVRKMNALYVSDDYEIVCWDIVSDPSTPNAWITPKDEIPSLYIENEIKKGNLIDERIKKWEKWLNN